MKPVFYRRNHNFYRRAQYYVYCREIYFPGFFIGKYISRVLYTGIKLSSQIFIKRRLLASAMSEGCLQAFYRRKYFSSSCFQRDFLKPSKEENKIYVFYRKIFFSFFIWENLSCPVPLKNKTYFLIFLKSYYLPFHL